MWRQSRSLVRLQDEAEVAYTRFASASIDPPEVAAAFRAGLGARWTFLLDTDRRYQAEPAIQRHGGKPWPASGFDGD
jgi:hypothetical protein